MPPIPLSKNQQKRWEELFEKNVESDSEYVPYVLKLSFTAALKARRSYEDRFPNGAETLSALPCPILFRGDNAMSKDDFSQILSEFLRDNHLSQADFAKKVGVRSGQVNEWLKGRSKPGYDTLKKFVCAFEASAEYFLGETEEY